MDRLIAIVGPTAVGKTKVSIDLAQHLQSDIISGDSMLIYRGLDIGTAKPSIREQQGVTHHLLDIRTPNQPFTVVEFQELANNLIHTLNQRGQIPILAGGTGLYVKSLLEGYHFSSAPSDTEYRKLLERLAAEKGAYYLHEILTKTVPAIAEEIHPHNVRRVIRALEVYHNNQESLSRQKVSQSLIYDCIVVGLTMDRAALYERINQRVDEMIKQGLIEEVERLLATGISPEAQALQGIGYKEVISYLQGRCTLSAAIDHIKQSTRHFAKRQWTWYRKMPYIEWIDYNPNRSHKDVLTYIYNLVARKYGIK